jgi:selenide,water dikinase
VIKAFAMRPLPGVRVTLVSRGSRTPYSGMLPGLIAGHYEEPDVYIDLVALCQAAGVRLIRDEARGLDPNARTLNFMARPPLSYDIVSLDIGSTPSLRGLEHTGGELICVKPIDGFLERWRELEARIIARRDATRLAIVGGGAGGVELALAAQFHLRQLGASVRARIVTADSEILMGHSPGVRRRFARVLRERGIDVSANSRIVRRTATALVAEGGDEIDVEEVLWVTQAAPAAWLGESGIALDAGGFVSVDERLRSTSHADVFAAGDIASMARAPRPKAGVFAVRQGPVLARNLRRAVLEHKLATYAPQRRFLSLISTGDRYAVASYGPWSAEGAWIWRWKNWIDRRFMRKYQDVEPMDPVTDQSLPPELAREAPGGVEGVSMRCGGCGAKIGAGVLAAALDRLEVNMRPDVIGGLQQRDDAALIEVPTSKLVALSVDVFRPIVEDPVVFGEIVANHCLNDLYAVGAEPQSALAIATLPVWPEAKLTDELAQMLAGALHVFARENVQLVGGHTSEGQEVSLGFSVTGLVARDRALTKTGLRAGDRLVLTKPLGTGALFAANMRARAHAAQIDAALAAMRLSNRRASEILAAHGAAAATDVTGFGLAGHLLEMLRGGDLAAELWPERWPVLDGAIEAVARGYLSTLHPANRDAAEGHVDLGSFAGVERSQLLFDPQTAGGLLAGIAVSDSEACLAALHSAGYVDAVAIGRVAHLGDAGGASRIRLQSAVAETMAAASASLSSS